MRSRERATPPLPGSYLHGQSSGYIATGSALEGCPGSLEPIADDLTCAGSKNGRFIFRIEITIVASCRAEEDREKHYNCANCRYLMFKREVSWRWQGGQPELPISQLAEVHVARPRQRRTGGVVLERGTPGNGERSPALLGDAFPCDYAC